MKSINNILKQLRSNADLIFFFLSIIILDGLFRHQLAYPSADLKMIMVNVFVALFFTSFMFLMGRKTRWVYGTLILLILGSLCFAQNLHYDYFSTFFSISKASILKEFFQVKSEAAGKITPELFIYYIPLVLFILVCLIKGKQEKIPTGYRVAATMFTMIISIACIALTFLYYPTNYRKSESDAFLFETLYNKARAVERLGLYPFTIRDAQLTLSNKPLNVDEEKVLIDLYIEEHGYSHEDNEYTGMFEGKNLILILCESLSNVAVQPELTPTLYKMKTEGISFDNHYAPVFQSATADSEFISLTSHIPSIDQGPLAWDYYENTFKDPLPVLFKEKGYDVNSFHSFKKSFYNREALHKIYGFSNFYDWEDLKLEKAPQFVEAYNWIHDKQLFDAMMQVTEETIHEPYFNFAISVSGHLPYVRERYELEKDLWQTILLYGEEGETYSIEGLGYLAAQKTLDTGLASLLQHLEEAGQLDNTVIALYGDHYPYGLTKNGVRELYPDLDHDYEIMKVPFIIWTPGMENPISVDKITSTFDIMPTLANLFNIDLSKDLITGRDALSDKDGLVIFNDYSWLTDRVYFNSEKSTYEKLDPSITEREIDQINDAVFEKIKIGQKIITTNYYGN